MPTPHDVLSSALTALAEVRGEADKADLDDLHDLDELAWKIRNQITGEE